MASRQTDNSHAQSGGVWDDSMLVDSWNDAVEEYKKYHSLEARGEDVNEVLKEATKNELNGVSEAMVDEENGKEPFVDDQQAKKDSHEEAVDPETHSAQGNTQVKGQQLNSGHASDKKLPAGPAPPQHLIGQVHDEGLKNLLMSWYYAGYYTGLFEGQQQAKTGLDAKHEA